MELQPTRSRAEWRKTFVGLKRTVVWESMYRNRAQIKANCTATDQKGRFFLSLIFPKSAYF